MADRHRMKERRFAAAQHKTFLQTLCYALGVSSPERLPKVFQLPVAVALKPGSSEELAARFNLPGDETNPRRMAFTSAMALYFKSTQYGHALRACDQFFSIDMEPAGTGGDELCGKGVSGGLNEAVSGNLAETAMEPSGKAEGAATTGASPAPSSQDKPQAGPDVSVRPAYRPRTPRERSTFHPEQRRRILGLFRTAFDVDTDEDLPAFLHEDLAIPLRVGVNADLVERYAITDPASPRMKAFGQAMRQYTRSRAYQNAMLNCETRYTIDMEPAEPISEEHRTGAIAGLRGLNKRRKARQEREAREAGSVQAASEEKKENIAKCGAIDTG